MTEITISKQIIAALGAADANIAIDQLDVLIGQLKEAKYNVEQIKIQNEEARVEADVISKVSYQWNNNAPTSKEHEIGKNLRKGSYREVRRFVEVDSVFVVCIGDPGESFDRRYRIVDSKETAKGVLMLHNLI